jgi:hypothetical protein
MSEDSPINLGTAKNGRTPDATPPSGITATSSGPAGNAVPDPDTVAIGPTDSASADAARSAVTAAAGAAAVGATA